MQHLPSYDAEFEREAKKICTRNQDEIDMKYWLSHWFGYKKIYKRHEQEMRALAEKYNVDLDMKKWKLY